MRTRAQMFDAYLEVRKLVAEKKTRKEKIDYDEMYEEAGKRLQPSRFKPCVAAGAQFYRLGKISPTSKGDPLIKSHQITLINQAHFDISSVRSGIEPERELENVETRIPTPSRPAPSCADPHRNRADSKRAEMG